MGENPTQRAAAALASGSGPAGAARDGSVARPPSPARHRCQEAIVTGTLDGTILSWSPGAEQLYGYRAAEVVGRSIGVIMPDGRALELLALLERVGRGEQVGPVETRRRRKDGRLVDVSVHLSPIVDDEGRVIGAAGVARDLTCQRALERDLRVAEERLRQIAENIREVFWLYDTRSASVLYVNPMYQELWGRSCHSLYLDPTSWLQGIHPDDLGRLGLEDHPGATCGEEPQELCYRVVRPDGSIRWVRDRSFPVPAGDGRSSRIAGIAEDVTEHVLADARMRRDRQQLRELLSALTLAEERERQRLATDLHDGVTQSVALAKLLLEELHGKPQERAGPVQREVVHILDQVLQALRSQTFQLSPSVLHDFGLQAALEWLAEDFSRRFGLQIQLLPGPPVDLDERLRVILFRSARELLVNVVKHAGARTVEIALGTGAGGVELVVEDDGRGLPAADGPEVGRAPPGHGLLSIRERLELLGGTLTLGAREGGGTRVVMVTPWRPPAGDTS